ncbi:MAG TPA: fumarate hydratase [Lachnospiraceae bacterium]|nr:fumarate hydratase [uncultured Lachnoclostridium sp.]HAU84632.1 fumarate hydratase [Lachnospiraceae bacterium]
MMRIVKAEDITRNIKEMCIEANLVLSDDVKEAICEAGEKETSELGRKIIKTLEENMSIAKEEQIPICQDTGMTVVFAKIGQDVHIDGMYVEDAINQGIREGYEQGYLRKSVVRDPINRINTKDNTPGVIHYQIVKGDQIELTVAPKGFGSENMSRSYMLKPADGIEGVKDAVIEAVKLAGPNACPPMVVGVGIGGTFEKCALLAKKALTRNLNSSSSIPYVKELEAELLEKVNQLNIGPAGLGGRTTALAVNVETYPTHIAGLPVAINICCHVNRHVTRTI